MKNGFINKFIYQHYQPGICRNGYSIIDDTGKNRLPKVETLLAKTSSRYCRTVNILRTWSLPKASFEDNRQNIFKENIAEPSGSLLMDNTAYSCVPSLTGAEANKKQGKYHDWHKYNSRGIGNHHIGTNLHCPAKSDR